MTWNDIKNRLKSPVVVWQIIVIVVAAVVLAWPTLDAPVKIIMGVLTAVYNLIAGLNNPADKEKF